MLGNKRSDHCSEVHYWKTLTKMGHEVIFLQESEVGVNEIMGNSNVDCFFWIHTHSWVTPGIDQAISFLKQKGVVTFGYHLDLYMGLQREPQIHEYVTKLEHFFTVDKLMADFLNSNTNTKGYYLPAGVFEDECYLEEPDHVKYPHEIIFTGSKRYHPEWSYRPKLIDWLHRAYGSRFAHYGGGGLAGLRGHELNTLYASAKIAIGDTLCRNFDYPFYSSDRLFETSGRGGFLIYPKIKGLEFFYEDKKEVVYYDFNDFDQLKKLIDYYLENNTDREKIRLAGHYRTKEAHTYRHRLKVILDTLNLGK